MGWVSGVGVVWDGGEWAAGMWARLGIQERLAGRADGFDGFVSQVRGSSQGFARSKSFHQILSRQTQCLNFMGTKNKTTGQNLSICSSVCKM